MWEKIGREVKGKLYTPKAVVHICANQSPKDITLTDANESKVKFIATGSTPLSHPKKLEICRNMEKLAYKLREYLPVILGIGIDCILPPITDEELLGFVGISKTDYDEREGKRTNLG